MREQSFIQAKCIDNIYHLAKLENISMKDLEKQAGLSQGYFSRLRKSDKDSKLAIQTIETVSNILGCEPGVLLWRDLEKYKNLDAVYYENFGYKLCEDTDADKIYWEEYRILPNDRKWKKICPDGVKWFTPFGDDKGRYGIGKFDSCAMAKLGEGFFVYMVEVEYVSNLSGSKYDKPYRNSEIYVEKNEVIEPVFDQLKYCYNNKGAIDDVIGYLQVKINASMGRVHLTSRKRAILEEYINS